VRARNREISIFSMSTLDVIFGALGAFTILMLAVMSEHNPDQQVVTQDELDDALTGQQMAIAMAEWTGDYDIDLWVDANGELSGPKPELFPGKADDRRWPDTTAGGQEDLAFSGASGDYILYLRLHSAKGHACPCLARAWFVSTSSEGTYATRFLGPIALEQEGVMVEIARFQVSDSGELENTTMTYWDTLRGGAS
jgi:hypothetical protein